MEKVTKEQVFTVLRVSGDFALRIVVGPGLTPRIRGLVDQLFALLFHVLDLAQSEWNAVGGIVINVVRAVVSQARAVALGTIDAADQFVTGIFRALFPKQG